MRAILGVFPLLLLSGGSSCVSFYSLPASFCLYIVAIIGRRCVCAIDYSIAMNLYFHSLFSTIYFVLYSAVVNISKSPPYSRGLITLHCHVVEPIIEPLCQCIIVVHTQLSHRRSTLQIGWFARYILFTILSASSLGTQFQSIEVISRMR